MFLQVLKCPWQCAFWSVQRLILRETGTWSGNSLVNPFIVGSSMLGQNFLQTVSSCLIHIILRFKVFCIHINHIYHSCFIELFDPLIPRSMVSFHLHKTRLCQGMCCLQVVGKQRIYLGSLREVQHFPANLSLFWLKLINVLVF